MTFPFLYPHNLQPVQWHCIVQWHPFLVLDKTGEKTEKQKSLCGEELSLVHGGKISLRWVLCCQGISPVLGIGSSSLPQVSMSVFCSPDSPAQQSSSVHALYQLHASAFSVLASSLRAALSCLSSDSLQNSHGHLAKGKCDSVGTGIPCLRSLSAIPATLCRVSVKGAHVHLKSSD